MGEEKRTEQAPRPEPSQEETAAMIADELGEARRRIQSVHRGWPGRSPARSQCQTIRSTQ